MSRIFFDAYTRFGPAPNQHFHRPWTLQHLIDEMHHCSISAALVSSTAQTQYDAQLENLRLIEALKPYDYLFPIWNVMPHWAGDFPEPAELTSLMQQHNIRAVMLHPTTNGWRLMSRTSRPLLELLQQSRTLTIFRYNEETNAEQIEYLAEEFPQLPILLVCARWNRGHEFFPLLRNYPSVNLSFDQAQLHYAPEWLVAEGYENQLVYASGAVDMSMGAHRCYVDYADIPETAREKFASGNLIRLLRGLRPPREIVNQNEDMLMTEARAGKPLSTLVIDMHAHMLDEGSNTGGASYQMLNGGPRGIREMARRMGVSRMGIMSWNGTVGVHAEQGNQCVRDAIDAYPDFYWGLGSFDVMHCTADEMRAQMEQLFTDKRFIGLKPYPQYGIPYNDPRFDVWWQFGNERKLYTGLHPVKWFKAEEFESICSRFPDLTVVAYHCGGDYAFADVAIELARKYPNFYAEITLTPVWGGIIDYLVKGIGADRVLYGTDLPMRDPRQQFGWVIYSRLSLEDKRKVLGLNAQKLLQRITAAQSRST
jgi:predicted TIM-barrel fold metal-dependent hydrolase